MGLAVTAYGWVGAPGGSAFRRNAGAYFPQGAAGRADADPRAFLPRRNPVLFDVRPDERPHDWRPAHGAFWALIGIVAAQLVPPHRLGLATAIIFGGVSAASVVGVPLASFIATPAGWRLAFMSMALLSLAAAAVLCSTLPPLAAPAPRQAACLSRYLPQSAARWPVWRHGLHHYRSLCRLHLH